MFSGFVLKLIAHRGNVAGRDQTLENSPEYIDTAISLAYDVEIDVRYVDQTIWLGHDKPERNVSFDWIKDRSNKLWIHCKDINALEFFQKNNQHNEFNFFWHENDTVTLTSKNYIWAFPGITCCNSIAVLPELTNHDVSKHLGVCSDIIKNYKNLS